MPKDSPRSSSLVISILAGITAVLLILVITSKYGIGVSPDSACYLSIAENLLTGKGYAIYDLEPAVAWPPLYPTVLAGGGFVGIEISVWARIINAVLLGLIVFYSINWLSRNLHSRPLFWLGATGSLLSPAILYVSKYAWSELPFTVLVILVLSRLEQLRNKPTFAQVLILALITSLACLTRYIGITLMIFCLIWILLIKTNIKRKVIYAATFVVIALAPLTIWIIRNLAVSSTLTGPRTASSSSFIDNILFTADALSSWLLPQGLTAFLRAPAAGVLALLFIAFLIRAFIRGNLWKKLPSPLPVMFGYSLFYIGFLIVTASTVALGRIDMRFTSPIYIPLLYSVLLTVDFILINLPNAGTSFRKAVWAISILWILHLTSNTFIEISTSLEKGAGGYATSEWHNSELIEYLSKNTPSGKLYSNYPDGIYALTGLAATMSPRKLYYASVSVPPHELENLQANIARNGPVYLAWFSRSNRGILYTPDDLRGSFDITLLSEFSDGYLYKISSKPPGV